MKLWTLVAVAVAMVPVTAGAAMLERQTGRAIRNAGHWCGHVTYMTVDTKVSTPKRRVVLVTCDDGTRYEQYSLVLSADNKISSIEKK